MSALQAKPGTAAPNRFYMSGVVARMALLAAALEIAIGRINPLDGNSRRLPLLQHWHEPAAAQGGADHIVRRLTWRINEP